MVLLVFSASDPNLAVSADPVCVTVPETMSFHTPSACLCREDSFCYGRRMRHPEELRSSMRKRLAQRECACCGTCCRKGDLHCIPRINHWLRKGILSC